MRRLAIVAICAVLGASYGDGSSDRQLPPFVGTLRVPEPVASVMVRHIRHIVDDGWGILQQGELYHGHILMKPGMDCAGPFFGWDELMACSAMMLYHSDEMERRWGGTQSGMPLDLRTPRSIVGYWEDGEIAPAALLVPDPEHTAPDYRVYGTIHGSDLVKAMPTMVAGDRLWEIELPQGSCQTLLQVMFLSDVLTTHEITVECRDTR